MNSVTNKTRLAGKRYRDKLKKKIRLNTKKQNKKIKKIRKIKENYNDYNRQLQKTKKTTKLQKKNQFELNKRKTLIRKQTESNKELKEKERRQKRENMVEDVEIGKFFELATSNKILVNNLNWHENKNEILQDYTGDFELNGLMIIGHNELEANRFKNKDHFESYLNTVDVNYDSEDVIFTGYIYKLKKPQSNVVKRSAYGKGTNYMQKIVEYHGQNCYIPTSGSDPNKEDQT